jgi:hypothetical protein
MVGRPLWLGTIERPPDAVRGQPSGAEFAPETDPIPSLLEIPHVHLHYLSSPPRLVSSLPWILRAPIRIAYQIVSVLHTCFFRVPVHTELLIVQNPPSIPTLALAQLVCLIAGSRLVIDWHNTGYSILSLRVGKQNPLVKVAKWYVLSAADCSAERTTASSPATVAPPDVGAAFSSQCPPDWVHRTSIR